MTFFELPALVKLMATFVIILAFSRFAPLYVGLLAGTFIIGAWTGLPLMRILDAVWVAASSPAALWLSSVIVLILVLSELLNRSGQLERIVSSFQAISPGTRFTLAAMPALIGLLPMPGGALFSAPMVDSALGKNKVSAEVKVAINYWFRHVWEYWWPLYPGIILAISLFGHPAWQVIALQSPLTLGALAGGIIFVLALLPDFDEPDTKFSLYNAKTFFWETIPITMVVAILFGLQGTVALLGRIAGVTIPWPQYLSFAIGLLAALLFVVRRNGMSWPSVKESLLNKDIVPMVMIVFGIMAFKGMLIESETIEHVRRELAAYNIPPVVVIAVLPLIAGLVTGIAIGFVGTSFPLVVTLFPPGHSPFPYEVLAYGFGFMGMMLSPLHLCLLVTKEYFCADFMVGYSYLWKPALMVMGWTVTLFLIYRAVFG